MSAAIRRAAHRGRGRARDARGARPTRRGSVLVFLPGQGEIRRVAELLEARVRDADVDIAPLYGALDRARPGPRRRAGAAGAAQGGAGDVDRRDLADHRGRARRRRQRAHARAPLRARHRPDPARDGARRRAPTPTSGAAAPAASSRASAIGCGRRRRPAALSPFAAPEILSADLSGLLLDLRRLGRRPIRRGWPSSTRRRAPRSPRRARCSRALGALDADGRVTDEGRAIAAPAAAAAAGAHGGRRRAVGRGADGRRGRRAADRTRPRRRRGRPLGAGSKPSAATARRGPRTRGGSAGTWRRRRGAGRVAAGAPLRQAERRPAARLRLSGPHRHRRAASAASS